MHTANASDLARLLAPLSVQSQHAAKKLPGVPEMLVGLEKNGAAALLSRVRARLGDGLNSYVHEVSIDSDGLLPVLNGAAITKQNAHSGLSAEFTLSILLPSRLRLKFAHDGLVAPDKGNPQPVARPQWRSDSGCVRIHVYARNAGCFWPHAT